MKTEKIYVNNRGAGRDAVLDEMERFSDSLSITKKNKLHLRLLTEEMLGMVAELGGDFDAEFWAENDGNICRLSLEAEIEKMSIEKREALLAVQSVWYSNVTEIVRDLDNAFKEINKVAWAELSKDNFAKQIARLFPKLWQGHPFREGNTRTTVMLMSFFSEHYGYYFDQNLMAESAGYVRDSFVLASLGEHSECEHLEEILKDAICTEPIYYTENKTVSEDKKEKYKSDNYTPTKHEYIE